MSRQIAQAEILVKKSDKIFLRSIKRMEEAKEKLGESILISEKRIDDNLKTIEDIKIENLDEKENIKRCNELVSKIDTKKNNLLNIING